jgi:hypothetical protein
MREIKFRVWDIDYKKMIYPIGIDWENEHAKDGQTVYYWVIGKDGKKHGTPGCKDMLSIMQFTGLKTSKKKKNLDEDIYEWDIFRHQDGNGNDEYSVVMWIPQRAAFYMIPIAHYTVLKNNDVSSEKEFDWLFEDASLFDFELDCGVGTKVGNVFENPEYFEK